jgi:hypothetical protein
LLSATGADFLVEKRDGPGEVGVGQGPEASNGTVILSEAKDLYNWSGSAQMLRPAKTADLRMKKLEQTWS